MSPAGYKRLDGCILPRLRQSQMQAQNIALCRYKSNIGGWACLRLRSNFALLAWVSFNVCQTIRLVAGLSLLHCLAGSFFESHDTVSGGKLCERANPWAQQLWQDIQGLKDDQGECFLLMLEDRNMDIFGILFFFFRIFDCSELRYRHLNITMAPQECLVVRTVVPVPLFFQVFRLSLQVKRSLLNQRIIRESLTALEREVFFVVPTHDAYHAYAGRDSQFTFVEHARNNYQCLHVVSARLSPTVLQRYGTYRNDWKLEPAVQKVRGVNMKQSLRRPW